MKTKTLSLSAILGFLGLILAIHSFDVKASTPKISCQTAFGEKNFTIDDSSVSFNQEDDQGVRRSISSLNQSSVRTLKKHHGFMKTLYLNGNKHQINIENVDSFSETNDYLAITSPKGHRITYPQNGESI